MHKHNRWKMWLGTVGVVYGDIGTSPLYTMRECFTSHNIAFNEQNILGISSLILWALLLIVTIKYVVFVIRADNHGEGGILALSTLTLQIKKFPYHSLLLMFALFGTALFYGDGVITPAISVLSALEGLKVYSSYLTQDMIVLLACFIILVLFLSQKHGASVIGQFFGPITTIWFLILSAMGAYQIYQNPIIFKALNPFYAMEFFYHEKGQAVLSLASVFLAITGAEALYADLGLFSRKAIRETWCFLIFPALILNYLGQGSLLLTHPDSLINPFYNMVPVWAVIPLVGLATFATIVASQAVISGIFSLSWQAIQLGYIPRRLVVHTSHQQQGHVYIPTINYLMMILTLLVILFFRQSHHLSTAYGITVNGIMMMTTILFGLVAHYVWKWNVIKTTLLIGSFLTLDMLFFGVNILKVVEGGWLPLLIALCAFMIMNTWVKGIQLLRKEESKTSLSMNDFLRKIKLDPPVRMPGTSIYMSSTPGTVPLSLVTNFKQYYCLSENVIFLSIITKKASRLLDTNKSNFYLQHLGKNIYEVKSYYGYMEIPDVTQIFEKMCEAGLNLQIYKSSFVFSRNLPVLSPKVYGLNKMEKRLFAFLAKHTLNPADFYKIPYSRVIELGVRYQI